MKSLIWLEFEIDMDLILNSPYKTALQKLTPILVFLALQKIRKFLSI